MNQEAPPSYDVRNTPKVATASFASNTLSLGAGTFSSQVLKIDVPKGLTHRRVYASFLNGQAIDVTVSSGQRFSGRVDFLLAGNLMYRLPFERHARALAGYSTLKVSVRPGGSEAQSDAALAPVYPGFQPASADSLTASLFSTEHVCPCWALNLACDAIILTLDDVVLATASGFLIACHSEGIVD